MTPTWKMACLEETTVDVGVGLGAGMCDSYLEEGMPGGNYG